MSSGAASLRRAAPLCLRRLLCEPTQSQPVESADGRHTAQRPQLEQPERNHSAQPVATHWSLLTCADAYCDGKRRSGSSRTNAAIPAQMLPIVWKMGETDEIRLDYRRDQGITFGTPPERRKSIAMFVIARTPTGNARSSP